MNAFLPCLSVNIIPIPPPISIEEPSNISIQFSSSQVMISGSPLSISSEMVSSDVSGHCASKSDKAWLLCALGCITEMSSQLYISIHCAILLVGIGVVNIFYGI